MKNMLVLAAFAAAFGLSISSVHSAPPTAIKAADAHHAMYANCAKICADCMLECEKMVHHCSELAMSGKKDHARPAAIAAACAELCAVSAKLTARHSDLAPASCEACAKACDMCAAECEKFPDMPEMKVCADLCKKCAISCREMAKMVHHKQ